MKSTRPDVVFDCNVFLQAIARGNGPAAHALQLVEQNVITLYLSRAILRELRRTLRYPKIREKNPQITDELIDSFLARLLFRGSLIRDVPHVVQHPRDRKDEPYLDLAAAVGADFLVTRDNDLLYLVSDHSVEAKEFRQRFPRLRILDPVAFIAAIAPPTTTPTAE